MKRLTRTLMPVIAVFMAIIMCFGITACSPKADATYTLTFIVSGEIHAKRNYRENELSEAPEDPKKDGFAFIGWNSEQYGGGDYFEAGKPVTESKTYYAQFMPTDEEAQGGQTPGGQTPGGETPGGQTPGGENPGTTGTTFTVTFDTKGGNQIPPETVKENGVITSLNPIKSGFTFVGWYTDSACTQAFDKTTPITQNITLYAKWESKPATGGGSTGSGTVTQPATTYIVTFTVDGQPYDVQSVAEGAYATQPARPEKAGQIFTGWYLASASAAFNFNTPISQAITLEAHFENLPASLVDAGAYNESLFVIWNEGAPSRAKVEYSSDGTSWTEIDKELIRDNGGNEARADILGLKAGSYQIKVTPSSGSAITVPAIAVSAYDRSGYAHFEYTQGVGAYNDDGTLKNNALVIYVTEQNKDTVMDGICANNDDINMFQIPYSGNGKNWNNKNASGIGWWLNNNQYTASNAGSKTAKRPSNTYDQTNGGKLGFKSVNRPIDIRIIGEVTTPEGLSEFDNEDQGGLPGDNGHMARMKNLKNITVEGVGEGAVIKGWGLHFIKGTDATDGQGESFEVRNLTFTEYPEDAIGMEGQQSGSTISAAVARCWVHNNTFQPGHCANPAESDKKEGDGSCDFKRGMYFTLSYNWFEYCHKTNLVGSSDSSLQYNITFHHNVWWQCGSRIPLTRQANVHFYNNFVYGDPSEKTSPYSWVSVAPSYIHSLRANCYIFSESNYYEGCKNVTDGKNGGAAKGWNNVVYDDYGTNTLTAAKTREQTVPNNCAYNGTDYGTFDTDPNLFYYDATNKVSKCLLDDAVTARRTCIMRSGANGHGESRNTDFNQYTVSGAVSAGTVTMGTNATGIAFNGVNKDGKFRGQGITFNLASEMQLTVTTDTTGEPAPELLNSEGLVYAHKFTGTLTIVLPEGTYIIASGQKDKDCKVTSMKFDDTGASSAARVEAARATITALPDEAALTSDYEALLTAAQNAFSALTATERASFDAELIQKLDYATEQYGQLQMAEVQRLINDIGAVTKDSFEKINKAQAAYDKLTAEQKDQLAGSKTILDAAWAAYQNFAVQNVIDMITEFVASVNGAGATTSKEDLEALKEKGDAITSAYEALSDEEGEVNQKAQVTNYNEFTTALEKLDGLYSLYEFKDALAFFRGHTVTTADASKVTALNSIYAKLTEGQKSNLTSEESALYESVKSAFETLMNARKSAYFEDATAHGDTDVFSITGAKKTDSLTIDGVNYNSGVKFQSSAGVLTVTVAVAAKLTLHLNIVDATLKYTKDGANEQTTQKATTYSGGGTIIELELQPGTYVFKKGDKESALYLATLMPTA